MKKLLLLVLMITGFASSLLSQEIRINQIGFYKHAQKIAIVPETTETEFSVIDLISGLPVYTSSLSAPTYSSTSGESNVKVADFTEFKKEGDYYIKSGEKVSNIFQIAEENLFSELSQWSTKAFYLWRASTAIESEYATFKGTDYSRAAGHPDTVVVIHASAATTLRPTGTKLSSPKGWYDAGDYNKYVVNASPAVFPMLHAYECFSNFYKKQNLNIPESSNNLPDILDEVKWETDWLLSMQDTNDGGVYFKLTDPSFTAMIMPADAPTSPRYLVSKSTTSTLDFAAMMAKTARTFREFETEFPGYADSCLNAAKHALEWAIAHPSVYFSNPSGISTGGYGDNNAKDEFFWARIELFLATGDIDFLTNLPAITNFDSPSWADVQTNGLLSLINCIDTLQISDSLKTSFMQSFMAMVDKMVTNTNSSAYKTGINSFFWGSNGYAAGIGMVLSSAYKYSDDEKYLNASLSMLDYLLGRNATSYCFVTGFGDKSPLHLHDRRAVADGIVAPMPGYLAGGPNPANQAEDCGASQYPSKFGAKSYLDSECSFSTNEIAINWNGPLVFLAGSMEAIFSKISIKPEIIESDTTGASINITYSEAITDIVNKAVTYTIFSDGVEKDIDSIRINPENTQMIQIFLSDSIKAQDKNITINSQKDSVFSISGMQISSLKDEIVINNVTGASPVIISAVTSEDGMSVILTLNKKIIPFDTLVDNFEVMVNGTNMCKFALPDSTSPNRILLTTNMIYLYDFVGVSFSGTSIISTEGGIMQPFDIIPVINTAPERPSQLISAISREDGFTLDLTFDKIIKVESNSNKIDVQYKNPETTTTPTISIISVTDNIVTVQLVERFTVNDTILISSTTDGLTTQSGAPISQFSDYIVTNTLPKKNEYILIDSLSPVLIQIEDYTYNNGFIKETCTDTGGGTNVGYTDAGDWLDYQIEVKHAGTYTISVRVASQSQASELLVQNYNQNNPINLCLINTPKTGGWQTWKTISQTLELNAGKQTLRLYAQDELFNLNWIQLQYGEHISQTTEIDNKNTLKVFPNPAKEHFLIQNSTNSIITITDMSGNTIIQFKIESDVPVETSLIPGVYIIKSETDQKQIIVY